MIEKKDSSKKVEDSEETISGRLARVMINEGYSLDILNHFKSKEVIKNLEYYLWFN